MRLVVASLWRNSAQRVCRYFEQVKSLKAHLGPNHSVRLIAVEGDSTDDTFMALKTTGVARSIDLSIVKCNHGGPVYGSTESPARMKALSKVLNAAFEACCEEDEVFVYVESDLVWDAHTVGSLADMALRRDEGFDIFAPLIFAGQHFYDVWAFRRNGARFGPFAPYCHELKGGLLELDSAGSCLAMRGEVARSCRARDDNALVGWCADARSQEFRIAVHPAFRVRHM
jgi:hypothetical protein